MERMCKIKFILLAAGFGLALMFTFGCHSSGKSNKVKSGESYAAEYGCRWNYQLQQGWVLPGETAENIRANATVESYSNPNCAEVIWEAVQRKNGSELSGESYASARGCRWAYNLQYSFSTEETRANAAVEALQHNNCVEVIKEARRKK